MSQQAYDFLTQIAHMTLTSNRQPAFNFVTAAQEYLKQSHGEISQLENTGSELTGKVQAVEDEIREMRKKIEEMKYVCDMKADNDALVMECGNKEIRVAQLRKALGKSDPQPVAAETGSKK